MREELSKDTFLEYRDKWLAGVQFDPIDVFFDGVTYWLADGFHRFYGAREAKLKCINATVHNGSQRDAILFACGANAAHGMRRTNADKRCAVLALLNDEEWVKWSDGEIADRAAVSQPFVSGVRKELIMVMSSTAAKTAAQPRKGKDGKTRKQPGAKPQKPKATPAAPPAVPKAYEPPTKEEQEDEPEPAAPAVSFKIRQFILLWDACDDTSKAAIRAHIQEHP